MVTNRHPRDNGTNFSCWYLTVILAILSNRKHPNAHQTVLVFSISIDRHQALVKYSPSFIMVDPVPRSLCKISKKQRKNVSRIGMKKYWTAVGGREFWHGRRMVHFLPDHWKRLRRISKSCDGASIIGVECSSSQYYVRHFYVSYWYGMIANWIAYKRTIWGRFSPRSPPDDDISQSSSRRSISNSSSSRRLVSCSVSQLVVPINCESTTKTDDAITILKESPVWKSMTSKFSIEEICTFFALIIGIGSCWSRRKFRCMFHGHCRPT